MKQQLDDNTRGTLKSTLTKSKAIMFHHWIHRASSCAWIGLVYITSSKVYASDVFEKPTSKWNYDWDNPEQDEKPSPSMFNKNIIMIRSAQSHDTSTVKGPRALTALGEYH
ncbi:uncharacterized protein LOC118201787 [Stegodyphus dumicola]|uniref:uncharacterized protein LOC118201787 n=1 Tax=Stegodyphus dumicola TaxID=202533 RepID=UPI0015A9009D|nr:uncharacterized protein LOC118201787 [Stegodyphus dumicola]